MGAYVFFLLFLVSVFLWGILLTKFFFKKTETLFFLASSFVLGSLVAVELIFLLYGVFATLANPLAWAISFYFIITMILWVKRREVFKQLPVKLEKTEWLFLSGIVVFSLYIFFRAFSYDANKALLLISSNTYLDFGAHIPLIRYFSLGQSLPGYLPFFGGQPLFYHFLFDFYAAVGEFLGIRIDLWFNIISAASLSSLLIIISTISFTFFKSRAAAILSNVLVLFNGTLTFMIFIKNNPFSWELISKIRNYNIYLDNGPFGSSPVSVFWNLNTFLNQRHFVFGLAFLFWLVLWVMSKESRVDSKRAFLVGILVGLLPLWHSEIFLMAFLLVASSYFLNRKLRLTMITLGGSFIVALPQIILIRMTSLNQITLHLGFLIENFNLKSVISYWIWNLGFYIPVIFIVWVLLRDRAKKLFYISLVFFLIPNIWQFSREIFNNHKFFNVWIIFMAIFASYVIVYLYHKNWWTKILSVCLAIFLTASGFLSFFVIKNDVWAKIVDYPKDNFMSWIRNNTGRDSLFMTNGDIYDPVTLTGRQTFLGKTSFVWAYGGDPQKRIIDENTVFNCAEKKKCLDILVKNKISYIVIYTPNMGMETKNIIIKKDFFRQNFQKVYESSKEVVFKI